MSNTPPYDPSQPPQQPPAYPPPPPGTPPPGQYPPPGGYQQPPPAGPTGQSVAMDLRTEKTLCYALTWVTGLIFILIEKENKEVRFHAWQSLIFFGGLNIALVVVGFLGSTIGFIGIIGFALNIGYIVAWIVMLIQTYQGNTVRLPIAADIASQQS
ncbi:MAG TPA: hypothetical protein VG245_07450 [Candidatus Dormibacteraeota bacterium]|jgi:uncharacterized membrane protein|nr:hypothetical protein [Candidatus Dormibacteraeota bacterium]